MNDLIREVVSIHGELIEFLGIIYLENGVSPKAMLFTRLVSEESLLAYQSSSDVRRLTKSVRHVAGQLASLYECEMDVTPISDLVDTSGYAHLLVRLQQEWEMQEYIRRSVLCMN